MMMKEPVRLTLLGLAGAVACLKVSQSPNLRSLLPLASGQWALAPANSRAAVPPSSLGKRTSHEQPIMIGHCDKTLWSRRDGRANQQP